MEGARGWGTQREEQIYEVERTIHFVLNFKKVKMFGKLEISKRIEVAPPPNPLMASISIRDGFPKSGLERERGEVFGKRLTSASI